MDQDIALSKLRPADPRGSVYQEFDVYDSDNEDGCRPKHKVTKKIKKFGFRKKKYKSITDEMREQLIDAIQNEGLKIKHAAKKLRMNYSSAKSIFKIFKREGRLNKKIFKRRSDPQEDGHSEGTPMSEDPDSSQETHSEQGVKEESSTSEGIQEQPLLKIVIPTQQEPEKMANSPLLKTEEVEETSVNSRKSSREELRQNMIVNEKSRKLSPNHSQTLLYPNQNQINFYTMEDFMKQNPYLLADNSAKLFANNNMNQQQSMFAAKMPGPFPPSLFLPKMDPLHMFGQGAPKSLQFTGFGMQQSVGPVNQMMMVNKINPYLSNPYVTNLSQIDPFINYSLLSNFNNNSYPPLRMNGNSSNQ